MTLTSFQHQLENISGKKFKNLHMKLNDNHSTMLSVKWEPDCTKISLHRMFLEAPRNIMQELACYIDGQRENIAPVVKAYIEDNLKRYDYRDRVDNQQLYSQGNVYNLKKIYNELNQIYFGGKLDLNITWYGKLVQRNRSRVTFGLYHEPLKLIKISRMLDNPSYPDYLVSYVVFHEMLHDACPAYVDEKGMHRVHSKEFKEREKEFRHFDLAQKWIKKNQAHFFV
jgi:hypothetical protein